MKKRFLGNTNIEVSEVAFGGVEIGMPYGIGVSGKEDMLTEPEAIELLHTALDNGINFFDTARMYGESEKIMGKAFKDRRDKVVLATKCIHLLDVDGNLPDDQALTATIKNSLYESLKTLQTDYVDIFMLHQANQKILENEAIISVFSKLKEQGLYRAMGVSTYTTNETKLALNNGHWNVIQLPFNLMDQRQGELFKDASKKGVGLVIRSVLLKGLLSDRGKNLHPALKDVEDHIGKYQVLLDETNLKMPALATKFALSFPEVSSVLIGIDKLKYLEEALNTVDGVYLDSEKLEKAKQLAYSEPEFINLPYWDKMNWLR